MYKGSARRSVSTLHSGQARAVELTATMELRTSPMMLMLITLCAAAALAPAQASGTPTMSLETHQYFVNQTYSWRQFACSEAERACLRERRLLHEADGRCYAAGARGPCADGQLFHADKREAARKGGHLRGTCDSRCDGAARPLAATGECLTRQQVEQQICREEWYLRPAMDLFGEWVCEWTQLLCSPRGDLVSGGFYDSPYDGLCSAPNLFVVISDGPNATVPAEKPANHPMLRYFSDKSYLEREFSCTEAEKECLQYGRVLQSDGKCYIPGEWSNRCEPGQVFHLDYNEMVTNGRLQGTCRSPCGMFKYPQLVTGVCADYSTMSNVCRWEWGLHPDQNIFGQMSCSCSWNPSTPRPPPPTPPAPAAPGHCRAPDFSNPVRAPHYDQTLTVGFLVSCSEEEFACLREGRVLAGGACHALRTRGPCADGEELVLDKHALAHARLQAVCKARPCPEGSVLLSYDGRCLTHEQVKSILCVGQEVSLDEFGGWQCDYDGQFPGNLTAITRNADAGSCELPEKYPIFPQGAPIGASFAGSGASSGGRPGVGFAGVAAPHPGASGGFGRPQHPQG